ncbi:amidohydrolase [Sphingomonas sp. PAMC 26617]|uniref:amidohydrolase n=1 Tax=Sphingomonas sp. PAMC 26617 TaxID=1112216 RepID=UPI0002895366|nr:amidohydrolase [Sphingomonas sp. PAMC 26617]
MAIRAAAVLAGAGAASAQVLFQSPPGPGAPAMADEVRQFVSLRQAELDVLTPQAREAYLDARNAQSTANTARKARRYASLKRLEAFERNFALAGGTLMAGCDPTGDGHIIPGFADQREIERLVDAGFSPLEAIRIRTLNGATYLGQASALGQGPLRPVLIPRRRRVPARIQQSPESSSRVIETETYRKTLRSSEGPL